ncbi:MAG: carboxypeptidase-like regulatory domain-containing protein [Saprospiraceae bacterium]|jgi:hypothetical protein
MKNYNDKIATYGVLIAVIAILVSLATPEIRTWIGFEKSEKETTNSNTEATQGTRQGKKPLPELPKKIELAKIEGCVFDSINNLLKGAKVSINLLKGEAHTDVNGFFEFSIPSNQPKGEYTITCSKVGYAPFSQTFFEIPKTDIKIYLKPKSQQE